MIKSFFGPNRFLSNFYPASIPYEGQRYPTVEHAYQAMKFEPGPMRQRFLGGSAGAAKLKGRTVGKRADFDQIKLQVMEDLCTLKFCIPELRDKLLATGDQMLQEGNRWGDEFWGVSLVTGRGLNHLGCILIRIRTDMRRMDI